MMVGMKILCDIGGTYARFAVEDGGVPARTQKYKAADYSGFLTALTAYCEAQGLEPRGALRIATAAYPDGDQWLFVNNNQWVIDLPAIKQAGWDLEVILNDFEAATWALLGIEDADCDVLKGGAGAGFSKCLIGPGTGLGLGYLHNADAQPFVQKTHGGHMPVAIMGAAQFAIVEHVQGQKDAPSIAVFEDYVSGYGLYNIYSAVCALEGLERRAQSVEEILNHADTPAVQAALGHFHDVFGQFAAHAVVTGHAYGGLYLTGGVLGHLRAAGLFDFARFEAAFVLDGAASVKRDLAATPIMVVRDPYPALKGLLHA
jgi:glucokinase